MRQTDRRTDTFAVGKSALHTCRALIKLHCEVPKIIKTERGMTKLLENAVILVLLCILYTLWSIKTWQNECGMEIVKLPASP